jgi:hypothetical protein
MDRVQRQRSAAEYLDFAEMIADASRAHGDETAVYGHARYAEGATQHEIDSRIGAPT